MSSYVPLCFDNLSIAQLQNMERNAISRGDNDVRFRLLRAGKGSETDRKWVMDVVKNDPTWIEDRI